MDNLTHDTKTKSLKSTGDNGFTASISVDGPSFSDQIRQIVREEIAAREERLKGEPEVISLSQEKENASKDYLKLNPTI